MGLYWQIQLSFFNGLLSDPQLLVVAWVALLTRQHRSPSTEQMIAFCIAAGWRNGRRGAKDLAKALMRPTPSRLPDLMVNGNGEIVPTNTGSALLETCSPGSSESLGRLSFLSQRSIVSLITEYLDQRPPTLFRAEEVRNYLITRSVHLTLEQVRVILRTQPGVVQEAGGIYFG